MRAADAASTAGAARALATWCTTVSPPPGNIIGSSSASGEPVPWHPHPDAAPACPRITFGKAWAGRSRLHLWAPNWCGPGLLCYSTIPTGELLPSVPELGWSHGVASDWHPYHSGSHSDDANWLGSLFDTPDVGAAVGAFGLAGMVCAAVRLAPKMSAPARVLIPLTRTLRHIRLASF